MIIIWGEQLYGKVDKVPKLFSVQTEFFHLWYLPLVPLRSYILVAGGERQGVRTRMSWKSVLVAWVRAALIIAFLITGLVAIEGINHWLSNKPHASAWSVLNPLGMMGGFVIFYALSHRFAHARYERALELAAQLGLGPEVVDEAWARSRSNAADVMDGEIAPAQERDANA
jgi:hypothetical protein